jgi:hypothetical protein
VGAMKHVTHILIITLFFASLFFLPNSMKESQTNTQETSLIENNPVQHEPAAVLPGAIRVALFNSTNNTAPVYVSGTMRLNNTWVYNVLVEDGCDVTRITLQDIQDHDLITANYDVLVLPDICPSENITDLVKEFWLSGGSILSFDTSISYLNYAGILPRESEGDNGRYTYWNYITNGIAEISSRHPAAKSYDNNSYLDYVESNYAMYYWSVLASTSIADDLVRLAVDDDNANNVIAIAADARDKGGKVVQIGIPTQYEQHDFDDMIGDAVQWLKPKPKGRIAYDLSHQPRLCVDDWDDPYVTVVHASNRFGYLRDLLVNHTFTFDKFYPSASGNFTLDRLNEYDIIVCAWPDLNYTEAERTAVENWVEDGGCLLMLPDRTGFTGGGPGDEHVMFLLEHFDVNLSGHNILTEVVCSANQHPTTEDVINVAVSYRNYVNITGDAVALIMDGSNIVVGADEYGEGRVVLSGEMNIFDNVRLIMEHNAKFAVNVANWLSASTARVLVYQDGNAYNSNFYRSELANALNELDLDFMLTSNRDYFNLSLNMYEWELVISDANSNGPYTSHSKIIEHLENGGKLIMRDFMFRYTGYPLWNYLGFEGAEARITTAPPIVYLWDSDHPIFNNPIDYQADNVTTSKNFQNTDFTNVTLLDNATALAGITESPSENQSAIVLGVDGRAICNQFAIIEYEDDTDDSTYPDNFEIWMNEIVYMMRPSIDSPSDVVKEAGSPGDSITWTPSSPWPSWVTVHAFPVGVYDHLILDEAWDGGPITVPLDVWEHLQPTDVIYTITVYDMFGRSVEDEVTVEFEDTTSPSLVEAPSNLAYNESTAVHLLNWTFDELYPHFYIFYVNGTMEVNGTWDGSELSVDVGGLAMGVWNVTIFVNDTSGNSEVSTVMLTVDDNTNPVFTDEPTNLEYAEGVSSHTLIWEITELHPDSFILYIDGVIEESGAWSTSSLSFNVGGLSEGTYNVTLLVTDTSGHSAVSTVTLTVTEEPTTTTETTTTGTLPFGLDTTTLIIIVAAAVGLIIIIIIIMKRRG